MISFGDAVPKQLNQFGLPLGNICKNASLRKDSWGSWINLWIHDRVSANLCELLLVAAIYKIVVVVSYWGGSVNANFCESAVVNLVLLSYWLRVVANCMILRAALLIVSALNVIRRQVHEVIRVWEVLRSLLVQLVLLVVYQFDVFKFACLVELVHSVNALVHSLAGGARLFRIDLLWWY